MAARSSSAPSIRSGSSARPNCSTRDSLLGRRNRRAKRSCSKRTGRRAYVRRSPGAAPSRWASRRRTTRSLAIATWQWPSYFDPVQRLKGIRLDLADYRRPDPATARPRQGGRLYMICTISNHKPERKGYADAMMLDWQGRVAECTGANIFSSRMARLYAHCRLLPWMASRARPRSSWRAARHRGHRAAHHAGRADRLLRVLHHRLARRSDGGLRIRIWAVHAWRHHPAADDDYTA